PGEAQPLTPGEAQPLAPGEARPLKPHDDRPPAPHVGQSSPGDTAPSQHAKSSALRDVFEPLPPDATVASGMIWPPVDGRLVLHELAQTRVPLTRTERGDWTGMANGRWRLHSAANAVFADVEEGRSVLVQSARTHAARERDHSIDRCLALAA